MATAPAGGTRTTFGSQSSSRRRSAPSFGFGSGTREMQEKVFVSQEHAALSSGGVRSPGPAVYTARRYSHCAAARWLRELWQVSMTEAPAVLSPPLTH